MAIKEDVLTAAGQNRCEANLQWCNYFWVTDSSEKLTEVLATSSEKCVAYTAVHKLQGVQMGWWDSRDRYQSRKGRGQAGCLQGIGKDPILGP